MLRVLIIVNWLTPEGHRKREEILDFLKYWPRNVTVDIVGIQRGALIYTLEKRLQLHLQPLKTLNKFKTYDLILTYDSTCAFLFALLKKLGLYRSIPHIMVDIGMPRAVERFIPQHSTATLGVLKHVRPSLICGMLKQIFNPKSVSRIITHSIRQRPFYIDNLGFSENAVLYIPFGIDTEYFKPESVESEDYIFVAGEFRDFDTLLRVYENRHKDLPELRIRSGDPPPNYFPPKVKWLPRAPLSTFKSEALKSRLVIVPLHYSLRSSGVMTCLHSMALGKAVLTSRVPQIDGYVVNGKTALYYKPYDENDLFRKISLLLKEDKLIAELGRKARIDVETNYNVKNLGMQLWNCVLSVLKNNRDSL
jgi:glycosyltransferase involved in cell wall biosynthesis